MPESVYRDAVTKLRILLEATEAASNVAAEVENETEAPKLSKNQEVRQINFVGSVDRNIDRLKVGEETQFGGFSSADRKNPKFVKSRAAKIGQSISQYVTVFKCLLLFCHSHTTTRKVNL